LVFFLIGIGDLAAMSSTVITRIVVVRNPQGLHARPADLLVREASRHRADIALEKGGCRVDCKSILSLLTLGAEFGTEMSLFAEGEDAEQAVVAIAELFENGFHELEQAE
jgi:phosphotransferase system HPr (HPr) family protein